MTVCADRARAAARSRALACLAVCVSTAAAAQQSPVPTPPPTPVAVAIPLPETAKRSDDLMVYLAQLEERLAPTQEIQEIEAQLPALSDRIGALRGATGNVIAESPALHEVDELLNHWRSFQDLLSDWSSRLTTRATQLGDELRGLDELRGIWQATRDSAKAANAPPELRDRIKTTLAKIQQTRQRVESYQQALLVLQDRCVHETAECRQAMDQLDKYRSAAMGRLLVRDAQPIWAPDRWAGIGDEAPLQQLTRAAGVWAAYVRAQILRVPFQLVLFAVLVLLWRRARLYTAAWAAADQSVASMVDVFTHPVSSALVLTLLASSSFYPQPPLIFTRVVRVAATLPLLRVLYGLVDPPIVPGLFALGAFFIIDQLRGALSGLTSIEQLLFLLEILAGVVLLVWMLRRGRIRQSRAARSPQLVVWLERGARLLLVLLGVALLAGILGFMQLARVVAGAVFGSGYAAMLLFAVRRFAQGLWAFALRTPTLRRSRMVERHRALLQARGERVLTWIAAGLWVLAALSSAELYRPASDALQAGLAASLTIGKFSISLGDVIAFAATIALSMVVSRFTRFVLAEDVYPRVHLARGLPYAFSTILHYVILLLGVMVGLAAAGVNLDRLALLAGAFSVGAGFGLQNVVNNFISGLILLFERPIQVGDTVQIGAVTGEIRRIGIRSSTVRTEEGAEVILPNGTLISDPVTNWTSSTRMRQITLTVSVPSGSSPETVIETLTSVAAGHRFVLKTPAPTALYAGFADNALNFQLDLWTDHVEQWGTIRSELGMAITKAFAESGMNLLKVT